MLRFGNSNEYSENKSVLGLRRLVIHSLSINLCDSGLVI